MKSSYLKSWLTTLGVGTTILWIVGLGSPYASPTIVWLDLLVAVLSFVGVAVTTPVTPKRTRVAGTVALALALFGLWFGGLVYGAIPWLTWWNFAFGCAYLAVGITEFASEERLFGDQTIPFRKSA